MNEVVKHYIERKQKEIEQKNAKAKAKKLIALGLFEKLYEGEEGYDPQNGCYEWSDEKQKGVYYNKIAIEVTDEEYEEILKVSGEETKIDAKGNKIATALKVIAWVIYGIGFILGLVLSSEPGYYGDEMNFVAAFVYWCVAFVSGTIFLGFAEIVRLLDEIKKKL